jgi:protease-4
MARMESPVVINDGSVLHINLNKSISELEVEEPLANLLPGTASESIGLMELREAIRTAKDDSKIEGIYLTAPSVGAGFSTLDEIRKSIEDFRTSGKWVIAYADYYSEGGYYLASSADKVYMNPTGQVELNGLAIEVSFFKKMFDKLEIKPEVFRVGDFKSAVEPFIRENMSEENRLQLTEMINSIYSHMLGELSRSRDLPVERLKEISEKMLVRNSNQAVEFGLIDSLYYDDQVKAELRRKLGIEEKKSIPFVKYSDYRKSLAGSGVKSDNEIAVIVADGDILPGKADQGVVGSSTIREQIRKARTSDRVKAIIIRVNSPGGAFNAADEMWREIYLASQEKPVIGSMGDYAASGGYYLAMACDTIVAQPNTITGSIGVFSILFDLSDFLGNKIGVTSEQVKTGEIGNLVTVTRELTPQEKGIWQKQTDEIYEIFTNKAAQGRNMTQADIKKVASGRVWTGSQALERGLVDKLGSFEDAVDIAAELANVGSDYKLRYYPEQKSFIEKWFEDYEAETRAEMIKQETGEYYRWYQQWEKVKTMQGTQARMPFEFVIQ